MFKVVSETALLSSTRGYAFHRYMYLKVPGTFMLGMGFLYGPIVLKFGIFTGVCLSGGYQQR